MRIKCLMAFTFLACELPLLAQDGVVYVEGSTQKIEQLVGDWDNERDEPTQNLTYTRFGFHATDLGVPFEHKGKTYILFGDIPGSGGDRDPIGFTEDWEPDDGLHLDFTTNPDGNYRPIDIPGVSMGGFKVPMEGVSWKNEMYIYVTTEVMTRSIVAKSEDDGFTFTKLYDLSNSKFINVSLSKTTTNNHYPEPENTEIQVMFGSGLYRQSDVYLAYQRADEIEEKSLVYFRGFSMDSEPEWTTDEEEATALFTQSCVGELSVSYNPFLKSWILLYNCDSPRGINCRVAEHPWGPWSQPFVIFNPDVDMGYCYFIHASWDAKNCDSVHDAGRENEWGGEYGAYQFEQLAKGDEGETTIYYTLSTWNPYTVVLMKTVLKSPPVNVQSVTTDLNNIQLVLYPNPANELIMCRFNHYRTGRGNIILRNILGQTIASKQILVRKGVNKCHLSIIEYPQGVYFVELNLPDSSEGFFRKIIRGN